MPQRHRAGAKPQTTQQRSTILAEAGGSPEDSAGLFTALLDRFAALGGVDLPLPVRDEPARASDFTMGNV